jgi:hypothetical protein
MANYCDVGFLLVVANLSANGDLNVLLISSCAVVGSLRIIAQLLFLASSSSFEFFLSCLIARLLLGFII